MTVEAETTNAGEQSLTEIGLLFPSPTRVDRVLVGQGGELLQVYAGIDVVSDRGRIWASSPELLTGVRFTVSLRGSGMLTIRWTATDQRRPTFIEREDA